MESEYWVHTENTISDGTQRWQEQYKQMCFWGSKGKGSETEICIKSFSQDAVVCVCATWILGSETQ